MVDFIKIIKIIPLLIVIIVIYMFYRFKIWKLLPKEGKTITTILFIYVIINQIISITIEDIALRLSMTVYITVIYMISILIIFAKFYKKVSSDMRSYK